MASPVRLADDGCGHDIEVQSEVPDHASDDRDLLGVFLSEHGEMGLDGQKQFGAYRGHAPEMSRPRCAAQCFGDPLDLDEGRKIGRIHLINRWIEDDVHAGLVGQFRVPFKVARIFLKVLVRAETGWG